MISYRSLTERIPISDHCYLIFLFTFQLRFNIMCGYGTQNDDVSVIVIYKLKVNNNESRRISLLRSQIKASELKEIQ